jgi:hypothetical protein
MRSLLLLSAISLTLACGGATDTRATRYNFALIDGVNQSSVAGAAALPKPVTSQLTRDPNGKFADRILDFVGPAAAYAQQIALAGTPVANAIVCGRESLPGEPKVVPLCAFTLADGKAVNTVESGTKAGTYNVVFTAQVPSQQPVTDSTKVVVEAGPMDSHVFIHGNGFTCWTVFPEYSALVGGAFVRDKYGNAVPFRFVTKGPYAHVLSDVIGSEGARTFVVDTPTDRAQQQSQPVTVELAGGQEIATGNLTSSAACVSLDF